MNYILFKWFDGEGGAAGGAADGGAAGGEQNAGGGAAGGAAGGGQQNAPPSAWSIPDDADFSAFVPADLKDDPSLVKFTGTKGKAFVENMLRSNISAQKMIGVDPSEIVRIPSDVAKIDKDTRKAVFDRMGLPKDEKAYVLKDVAKPVKGLEANGPLATWFQKAAQATGVFPDQAQALYESYVEQGRAIVEQQNNSYAAIDSKNVADLQRELGPAYDPTIAAASYGLGKLFPGLKDRLDAAGFGTDPVFIKGMAKIGEWLGEGTQGGDKQNFGNTTQPSAYTEQGKKMLAEALQFMESDPQKFRRMNDEATKLFKLGAGGK